MSKKTKWVTPLDVKSHPKKGRVVFAKRKIKAGEIIEISPAIRLSPGDVHFIEKTILQYYIYNSPNELSGECCLALGFGSLFNHSNDPNVRYDVAYDCKEIYFEAIRDIKKNEELTIDYGWYDEDE